MPFEVTPEKVYAAIMAADAYGNYFKGMAADGLWAAVPEPEGFVLPLVPGRRYSSFLWKAL